MRALLMIVMIAVAGCAPALAQGQQASPATARSERPLVFVATTGLEDAQALSSVFRHARTAAETDRLSEVVVLVYGRAIQAFDADIARRPHGLVESIRAAQAAGVRVLLCANAMDQMGVHRERVEPAPTAIVPNAIETLVDYVARGAAVVRY